MPTGRPAGQPRSFSEKIARVECGETAKPAVGMFPEKQTRFASQA
jgi:hypothetical protein